MEKLLGIFVTEDGKMVILEKTLPGVHLNSEAVTVRDLKYVEQEFPNLIQRYEINLIGDNPDVSDNEARPRL